MVHLAEELCSLPRMERKIEESRRPETFVSYIVNVVDLHVSPISLLNVIPTQF